jgi:hypothetical protein
VRAPHANTFAGRWVETVRADCLDHLLIFSHRQLERVLRTYVEHYNEAHLIGALGSTHPGQPPWAIQLAELNVVTSSTVSSTSSDGLPEPLKFIPS